MRAVCHLRKGATAKSLSVKGRCVLTGRLEIPQGLFPGTPFLPTELAVSGYKVPKRLSWGQGEGSGHLSHF